MFYQFPVNTVYRVGRTLVQNGVMIERKWMTWDIVGKLFIVSWENIDVGQRLWDNWGNIELTLGEGRFDSTFYQYNTSKRAPAALPIAAQVPNNDNRRLGMLLMKIWLPRRQNLRISPGECWEHTTEWHLKLFSSGFLFVSYFINGMEKNVGEKK